MVVRLKGRGERPDSALTPGTPLQGVPLEITCFDAVRGKRKLPVFLNRD